MGHRSERFLKISLAIYITLVVMNSIKFIGLVTLIGSIGKLLFCLTFISFMILFLKQSNIRIKFLSIKYFIGIVAIVLFFAVIFNIRVQSRINLLSNLAFPVYLAYYFLIVYLFTRIKWNTYNIHTSKVVEYKILSIFRTTLFLNFIFWFIIALGSGVNLFLEDGAFGGFFQDDIHFGLFVVTGFLISMYFKYNETILDTSFYNNFLLFLYGGIAMFTSRNALLIVITVLFFYFVISKIRNRFLKISTFSITFVIINIFLFIQDFTEADIVEITSGRYNIWNMAINKMISDNFMLAGKGLFNLNNVILQENRGIGFYYLDSLQNLSLHSSYMEILGAGGIITLILYLRILFVTWKRLNRIKKAIMLSISVGAFFESFLMQPFMLMPTLFYLIIICNSTISLPSKVNKDSSNSKYINSFYLSNDKGQLSKYVK